MDTSTEKNITYLFGAGASYNSLPIVEEFPEAMKEIVEIAKSYLHSPENKDNIKLKRFASELEELVLISDNYKTIDTYARKLVLSNDIRTLTKLKITLSIFFEIWQNWNHRSAFYTTAIENSFITTTKEYIDKRYTTLFSNLLTNENGELKFPHNVNFLTWNYDLQMAKSLNLFYESDMLSSVYTHFSFLPKIDKDVISQDAKIVHLNGIAGLYELSNGKSVNSIIDRINDEHTFVEAISKLSFIYDSFEEGKINFENTFSFAWEETHIAQNARKRAKEIMSQTDILIIVGYSFPAFNLNIDRELFEAFKQGSPNHSSRVYYQDKNPNKEIIRDSFGIEEKRIFLQNDTEQFFLPRQYL